MTKLRYMMVDVESPRICSLVSSWAQSHSHSHISSVQSSGRAKPHHVWLFGEKKQGERCSRSTSDALQSWGWLYPHWLERIQNSGGNLICSKDQIRTSKETSRAGRARLRQECRSNKASHEKQVRLQEPRSADHLSFHQGTWSRYLPTNHW